MPEAAVAAAPAPAEAEGVDDLLAEAMDDGLPTPTPPVSAPSGSGSNSWLEALDEERAAKARLDEERAAKTRRKQ